MLSIYDDEIPLAFSFLTTECEQIYPKLNIDLSNFLFESDQGKSLKSFYGKSKIENIVCIRHLLANLRKKPFGFHISTLVKCRNQIDLDTSFCYFSNDFQIFYFNIKNKTRKKTILIKIKTKNMMK